MASFLHPQYNKVFPFLANNVESNVLQMLLSAGLLRIKLNRFFFFDWRFPVNAPKIENEVGIYHFSCE